MNNGVSTLPLSLYIVVLVGKQLCMELKTLTTYKHNTPMFEKEAN